MELDLDKKLNQVFPGKVVRKDLTKLIKEGANVPVYVLEYLLGMYCASDSADDINTGLERVKKILAENYVRPDEAEKIKSRIREAGTYTVIDKVSVVFREVDGKYWATLHNINQDYINIGEAIIREHERLLLGGIWA
ncbi:MAG: anti-phage BREX system Lon protease BrxL, partial [bacterium]